MRSSRTLPTVIVAGALLLAGVAIAAAEEREPCCFTNVRYTGVCQVVPAPDETCGSILRYLNDANSVGKGYCGNTNIRTGWARVACDPDERSTGLAVTTPMLCPVTEPPLTTAIPVDSAG